MNNYSWIDRNVYGKYLKYIKYEIEFGNNKNIIKLRLNGAFRTQHSYGVDYMYEIIFNIKIKDKFCIYEETTIKEDAYWNEHLSENTFTYDGIRNAIEQCRKRNSHVNQVKTIFRNVTADTIVCYFINMFGI